MSDITRKLAIFGCLLLTGFCFWKAGTGLIGGVDAEILPSAQAAMSPSISPPRVVTTPIQQMRSGMRVVGRNPLRIQTEATIDPTPAGWQLVSVRMRKEDGTYFEAELLRPLSWLRQHQAQPGAVIMLNMPELHVVGAAEVLAVSACPPIDPGDGPVVLSTFKNVAKNVLNIYVEGEAEPIGVTAGHPIWSEDRQAFVHSDQLQPGERLRSAVGKTVRITSIEIRAGPEPVYNLEVAGEHVYSVTDSGLLVHNSGPCYLVPRGYYDSGFIGIVNGSADEFSDTLRATFGTYDVLPSSRLVSQADTVGLSASSSATRRAYLNEKFGRTGNLNVDINTRAGFTAQTARAPELLGNSGANARELAQNLAREGRPVLRGEAAGHLVPSTGSQGHWAAGARARQLLQYYGIRINGGANGIPIGHPRPHNLTHRAEFLRELESRLMGVVEPMKNNAYGHKAIRSALQRELRAIGRNVQRQ